MKFAIAASTLIIVTTYAQTLSDTVLEILHDNPTITERLANYQASKHSITIAEAGYYPKVDLSLGIGQEQEARTDTSTSAKEKNDFDFDIRQASATLSYNLFKGFETISRIDEEHYRSAAAAYSYIEKVNDLTLEGTSAYLEILRNAELLEISKQNVAINDDIFSKVKKLYDAGLTTLSEVNKIESSLALARSNEVVNDTNLAAAHFALRRLLGRDLATDALIRPTVKVPLPKNEAEALEFALNNNPSTIITRYNIQQAQASHQASRAPHYPSLDLEITKSYSEDVSAYQESDTFKTMLYLNYNLFNGMADTAASQRSAIAVMQERANAETLHREVTEALQLAWSSYTRLDRQLQYLKDYLEFSQKTLSLYSKEYDLGRRSLLDLLSAQSDYIGAQSQIIDTEYNVLIAKYRLLDAMGTITLALLEKGQTFYEYVGVTSPQNKE